MKHAGKVVTRTMLLENVWDYHFDPQTNVIDVHMSRLRAKIDKGFDQPAAAHGARRRLHDAGRCLASSFRLFRTTAFKLSAIFLAVFTVFSLFLIGTIAGNMNAILEAQMGAASTRNSAQCAAVPDRRHGRLARVVAARSHPPGASLYFVTDPEGTRVAGNVESVPTAILDQTEPIAQVVPYIGVTSRLATSAYGACPRGAVFRRCEGACRA